MVNQMLRWRKLGGFCIIQYTIAQMELRFDIIHMLLYKLCSCITTVLWLLTNPLIISSFICILQDHNKDYIVQFPDISPNSFSSDVSKRKAISEVKKHRRFVLSEVSASLPHPHLWYSTKEAIKALELFLNAGNDLSKSLTYRYVL